jgi:hypothetical protein
MPPVHEQSQIRCNSLHLSKCSTFSHSWTLFRKLSLLPRTLSYVFFTLIRLFIVQLWVYKNFLDKKINADDFIMYPHSICSYIIGDSSIVSKFLSPLNVSLTSNMGRNCFAWYFIFMSIKWYQVPYLEQGVNNILHLEFDYIFLITRKI